MFAEALPISRIHAVYALLFFVCFKAGKKKFRKIAK
jgi:hypothetical protein